jgi:hypothetical protein
VSMRIGRVSFKVEKCTVFMNLKLKSALLIY